MRRKLKFLYQRIVRGWDDSETWSLDYTIAKFTLPRLKRFKELNGSYPHQLSMKEWDAILDDIIYVFEAYKEDNIDGCDQDRRKKGLEYFGKYFSSLWS